ncbi:hypothetical protein [Marininema halotolerans]|uniref:Uncharacterized protein n=1 Tax=Marininema halotolerans TaxID=1155944 RepID=A0A1I6SSS7_9BACL|nr:hypothetical protein [Marininema halotolerans]SFS79936.1 hypothetical protein SAMN05444972_10811 [Marininema halotolerans]
MAQKRDPFQLANLLNEPDALNQIAKTEEQLNQLLDKKVALVAYAKDQDGSMIDQRGVES